MVKRGLIILAILSIVIIGINIVSTENSKFLASRGIYTNDNK